MAAMATLNFEAMAAKFDDSSSGTHTWLRTRMRHAPKQQLTDTDVRAKGAQAIEIRDNIESYCQGQSYAVFLHHMVPVFLKILDGNPVFISTSPEQVSAPGGA